MISDIQALLDKYIFWLKDKTVLREVKDWVEITTPYLDRHNDYLQIYAKKHNGGFLLTDDSYIIDDLEQTGCKLESTKRQQLLRMTLNGFGVQLHERALQIVATPETFAVRKHNLIQAMLAINDMFYLATPMVASIFYEDVMTWLDSQDIRFTPRVKFTGKTGYDHLFDFVIPKSRARPERILQSINRPNRQTAESLAFAWIDTKEVRAPDSKVFALLNDQEQTVSSYVVDALKSYDVMPVLWNNREDALQELVA
jgi:Domain of unknown function DUF1829/Domain of unknown function DUF1828